MKADRRGQVRILQSDLMIYAMLVLLSLAALLLVLGKPFRAFLRLAVRSVIGACAIFAADFILSPLSLSVGINCFTAVFTGLLGIPGFVTLYILAYIIRS